jgi:uncharacterized membrane protein
MEALFAVLFSSWMEYFKFNIMESNNPYLKFVANYSDEEILKYLDHPSDIDFNVYNALIIKAKERGLISDDDISDKSLDIKDESVDRSFLEAEKNKYWKCPHCHQLVEMDFVICWNCQKEQPVNVEHPNNREILEETEKTGNFNSIKTGYSLIACGFLIFIMESVFSQNFNHIDLYRLVFAILFVLAGIIFIFVGISDKRKNKE